MTKFLALIFLLVLGSCQTVGDTKTTNIIISKIILTKDESILTSQTFEPKLTNALKHYAAAYNEQQSGTLLAYHLHVHVTGVHYKNPLASLVVGDANRVIALTKVIDPTNGQELRSFETGFIDGGSAILNGLSGAILAANVGKAAVDSTLAKGLPIHLMQRVFLTKSTPTQVSKKINKTDILSPFTGQLSPLEPEPTGELTDVLQVQNPES